MVVHAFNPSTQEAEAGGLQDPGQPGLHSEILSQNKTNKKFIFIFPIKKSNPASDLAC
jgi:hypothetical protein